MKEITRIHLAKTPFEIETNAKKDLEKYLSEIEKNMRADTDAMREIEARMVEILAERSVAENGVISASDVAAIKETLGEAQDFAGDESHDVSVVDSEKRLMRDLDNAWVGGVGAGVAAYFGIDALIMRAIMIVLMIISFGAFLFAYLLLWLLIPPAKTAADKLRMRGKPVTLEALQTVSAAGDGRTQAGRIISVVLRTAAAIGLGFAAIGAFTATVIGGIAGISFASILAGSGQAWFATLVSALIVGGLALTTLLTIGAVGLVTLRATRVMKMGALAALIIGIAMIPVIGVSGPLMSDSLIHDTQQTTVTLPTETVKDAQYFGSNDDWQYVVFYHETDKDVATARIAYREEFFDGEPQFTFSRIGSDVVVSLDDASKTRCSSIELVQQMCDRLQIEKVDIYGPPNAMLSGRDVDATETKTRNAPIFDRRDDSPAPKIKTRIAE